MPSRSSASATSGCGGRWRAQLAARQPAVLWCRTMSGEVASGAPQPEQSDVRHRRIRPKLASITVPSVSLFPDSRAFGFTAIVAHYEPFPDQPRPPSHGSMISRSFAHGDTPVSPSLTMKTAKRPPAGQDQSSIFPHPSGAPTTHGSKGEAFFLTGQIVAVSARLVQFTSSFEARRLHFFRRIGSGQQPVEKAFSRQLPAPPRRRRTLARMRCHRAFVQKAGNKVYVSLNIKTSQKWNV